jgi:threonylcarbamoyladenosine tRNA methylthiotransferase CDKAL1
VRKNKFVEILPINVGCLGACTYCKTKHARGHLGSYTTDSLRKYRDISIYHLLELGGYFTRILMLQVGRVKSVIADGVKEIWLSSEDTGAYGK